MRSLIYLLRGSVRTRHASEGWRLSKEREHWLYDEIGSAAQDRKAPFDAGRG
ncbi:MAG TPA: hypothetical protein VGE74_05260 [Gemmata sp.]